MYIVRLDDRLLYRMFSNCAYLLQVSSHDQCRPIPNRFISIVCRAFLTFKRTWTNMTVAVCLETGITVRYFKGLMAFMVDIGALGR